eukprot:15332839-Ditylum_brightwellii.AAC.2
MKNNQLTSEGNKDFHRNSICTIVTLQKNIPIKNASQEFRKYTGIYKNLLMDETSTSRRKPGCWYDYFLKRSEMKQGVTMEQAFEKSSMDDWNIKTCNDGIIVYDKTLSR